MGEKGRAKGIVYDVENGMAFCYKVFGQRQFPGLSEHSEGGCVDDDIDFFRSQSGKFPGLDLCGAMFSGKAFDEGVPTSGVSSGHDEQRKLLFK